MTNAQKYVNKHNYLLFHYVTDREHSLCGTILMDGRQDNYIIFPWEKLSTPINLKINNCMYSYIKFIKSSFYLKKIIATSKPIRHYWSCDYFIENMLQEKDNGFTEKVSKYKEFNSLWFLRIKCHHIVKFLTCRHILNFDLKEMLIAR